MSTKDNVIRDFTAKRDTYYETNYVVESPQNYIRRLRRRLIAEMVGDAAAGAKVLDAGCGPAILFPEVLERCRSYTALDLTPSNLECIQAANQDPRVSCVVGDLDSFPWESDAPDVIICSGALEYAAAAERTLGRMIGLLREGGLLVCSFPNMWSPYRLWSEGAYTPLSRLLKRLRRRPVAFYPRRLFSPAQVRKQVGPLVRHMQIRFFGHRWLMQPLDALFPILDHRIDKSLESASASGRWWDRFASEFIVAARR